MSEKLTAAEVAKWLKVSKQTVLTWARQGKLPCQRVGFRPVLFDREEIEKLLQASGSLAQRDAKAVTV